MILNTDFLSQVLTKYASPEARTYITDDSARIFASTDVSRIGTSSTTAQFILRTGRTAIIEHEDGGEAESNKQNLVTYGIILEFDQEVFGVIVSSGLHSVVVPLGALIKASLETAVAYQHYSQTLLHNSDERTLIANALLDERVNQQKVTDMMNRIEMDAALLRSVICISLKHHQPSYFNINLNLGYQSSVERINEEILKRISASRFFNTQDLMLVFDRNTIIIIKSFIQNSDISRAYLSLDKICEDIESILSSFTSFSFHIAYGNLYRGVLDVRKSFLEATEIINIGIKTHPTESVYALNNLMFDNVCHYLQPQIVNKIILPAIAKLTREDKNIQTEIIDCAEAFVDNCMNISQTSSNLFLHRNTTHTRLEKLKEKTGLDPANNFADAFVVKMLATYIKLNEPTQPIQ